MVAVGAVSASLAAASAASAAVLLLLAAAAGPRAAEAQTPAPNGGGGNKVCPALGKQCEAYAPCCTGQFCVDQPWGCMESEGCSTSASFPGTPCTKRPMCKSFREEFNDPSVIVDRYNYTGDPDAAKLWRQYPGADVAYVENGNLVLEMRWSEKDKRGQGATIPTVRWLQYGTISARMKVSGGQGVINSFITKTDISDKIGDEIDFEFLGGHPNEVQTNFYWDGHLDWTKGGKWNFPSGDEAAQGGGGGGGGGGGSTTTNEYHTYTIDWKPDKTRWLVDGVEIRSITPMTTDNKYPSQVARVFFSIWDGGCGQAQGTVDWAGGPTAWCKDESKRSEVKKLLIDWLEIKCYQEDTTDKDVYMPIIKKPEPDKPNNGSNGGGSNGGGDNGGSASPPPPSRTTNGSAPSGGNAGSAIGSSAATGITTPAAIVSLLAAGAAAIVVALKAL